MINPGKCKYCWTNDAFNYWNTTDNHISLSPLKHIWYEYKYGDDGTDGNSNEGTDPKLVKVTLNAKEAYKS